MKVKRAPCVMFLLFQIVVIYAQDITGTWVPKHHFVIFSGNYGYDFLMPLDELVSSGTRSAEEYSSALVESFEFTEEGVLFVRFTNGDIAQTFYTLNERNILVQPRGYKYHETNFGYYFLSSDVLLLIYKHFGTSDPFQHLFYLFKQGS